MDWLMMRAFYIAGISLFWLIYIFYRFSVNRNILSFWGFKKEFLKKTIIFLSPLVFLSIIVSILYGYFKNGLLITWSIIPILILYPMWGIIQQYLMLGIISQSLLTILEAERKRFVIIFLVSFFFGLIHYPTYFLMIFTFIMEVVFITVYFKWRNLWAIGIAHGWIATFLLYYVLERDLWTELFQLF